MLISTGKLTSKSLAGQVAVVTGAGRGIGFEAARALLWLGAAVVLAEIDKSTGIMAETQLAQGFDPNKVHFIHTDVGDERSVKRMKSFTIKHYGKVDIVINNATITPMGAVQDININNWDASYRVNMRGPVLLAQQFLPGMLARDYGVFICISSVGEAFMGAYECFKAAQIHLAQTLAAELENTGVHAFSIGPGLVHTPGALAGIQTLAPLYGKSVEEFFAMSKEHIISVEAAGAGYAAAAVLASDFRGQEISAKQALIAVGIDIPQEPESPLKILSTEQRLKALSLCHSAVQTLKEQADGWAQRPLFERQWMLRDFTKNAGMPVERWLAALEMLCNTLASVNESRTPPPLHQLAGFYGHMQDLAKGYEKDPKKLADYLSLLQCWEEEILLLSDLLH